MAILKRIKTTLAIHVHRKVTGLLDGLYASKITGRSLDFSDLREYVIGDDVKDFDWKATARYGRPLIRRYVADRKHTLAIAITTGRDMAAMANATDRKCDVALMAAGLLGYLATRHGDYVCVEVCDGSDIDISRPSTREVDLERMLGAALERCADDAPPADLERLFDFTIGGIRRRMILLLIVDDIGIEGRAAAQLRRLAAQHEVLVVTIGDLDPTDPAYLTHALADVASGTMLPDFLGSDELLNREMAEFRTTRHQTRNRLFRSLGIPHVHLEGIDEVVGGVLTLMEASRHVGR